MRKLNWEDVVEKVIFSIKWLLIPFYLKLFYTLGILMVRFFQGHAGTQEIIHVLEDVDIVMIANLVKMIVTGSYSSFVNKYHGEEKEKTTSGMLKVKMAGSLVGVSSIFMLKEFLEPGGMDNQHLAKLLLIHSSFLVGALILAIMDYLHVKCEKHENERIN
jgi:uncharacterized protein (TIGR00645 family)